MLQSTSRTSRYCGSATFSKSAVLKWRVHEDIKKGWRNGHVSMMHQGRLWQGVRD